MKAGLPKQKFTSTQMGNMNMKKGGEMKESKAMVKKEVEFMKKKGAPKSMVKHEAAEMATMKKGGKAYSAGGYTRSADGVAKKGKTRGTMVKMMGGGKAC